VYIFQIRLLIGFVSFGYRQNPDRLLTLDTRLDELSTPTITRTCSKAIG